MASAAIALLQQLLRAGDSQQLVQDLQDGASSSLTEKTNKY